MLKNKLTCKPFQANATDFKYWSFPSIGKNRTEAKLPERPPPIVPGSFEIVQESLNARKIFVYWQKIGREEENGPDFGYTITEVSENGFPR